jgi:hypothetical protein
MTCACPPGWCYLRPDCRHPHRRNRKAFLARAHKVEAAARSDLAAIGNIWLYERREDLQAELAGELSGQARKAKTDALQRIEAIILRKETGVGR